MGHKTLLIIGIFIALVFGLGNSGLHPTSGTAGYTGAPGDSSCGECHSGNNASLNGNITISGLPSTIITGESYTLTITISNPNGNAERAGFQMVVLNGTNTNAGTLAEHPDFIDNTEILTVFGGKKYIGHNPAMDFPATNEITYLVNWTAPSTTGSNPIIKFYASAVIGNGNNSSSQDRVVFTNSQIPIQNASQPLEVTLSNVTGTSCSDSNNGTAQANATGGSGTYFYSWSNGVTTSFNTLLPPGIATVTVSDNLGAVASASTNITSPPAILLSVQGTTVCQNTINGSASVIASGGTGTFSYNWSNGATANAISGLAAGLYTVTVSDSNGCTTSGTTEVITSPEILIMENINHVTCSSQATGSIFLSVSGGTPGFSYVWSNGSTQSNLTNLIANVYTVTVTDASLCSTSESYIIDEPQALSGSVTNLTPVSCYGNNDGAATIIASGGSPSYSFMWSTGASGSGFSSTQNGLSAGNYFITVIDLFDCETIVNIDILQPDEIIISADEKEDITCFGNNDGSIEISVAGITGMPLYLWSNQSNQASISGLLPGIYSVTVTDSGNNCTQTTNYFIAEPSILHVEPNNIGDVACYNGNNGTVVALVSGGTEGYSYQWNNGNTSNILHNLTAGTYSVTVTDSNGCTDSVSVNINQPPPIQIDLVATSNTTCIGAANGSLTVSATNGFPPYQYFWQNGITTAVNNNLTSGDYTVTVTDANQCTSTALFTVQTNSSFQIEITAIGNVYCHGDSSGMVTVTENEQFTYLWSNGSTGNELINAPAGMYTVVATDLAGCQSNPLNIQITQPMAVEIIVLQADTILCPGEENGFISIGLSGGTGELSWQWSNGVTSLIQDSLTAGVYDISVSDSLNCQRLESIHISVTDSIKINQPDVADILCYKEANGRVILNKAGGYGDLQTYWSNGITNRDTISGLSQGEYHVTIIDAAGCMLQDSFFIDEPDSLYASILVWDETQSGKNDGMVSVTPIGGVAPFNIVWSNGSTDFSIENLSPGLYSFDIRDFNNCSSGGWAVVGGGNCILSATVDIIPPSCFNSYDGQLDVKISGQFNEYKIQLFSENEEVFLPFDSLYSGTYTLIITDSLQCTALIQDIKMQSEHPAILLDTVIAHNPSTSISKDGSLQALVSGGIGELSYEWYKDGIKIGTNAVIEKLSAGIYTLLITDSVGCKLEVRSIFLQTVNSVDDEFKNAIKLQPNPVFNDFTVINLSTHDIEKLEIFDLYGKLIFTDSILPSTRKMEYNIQNINIYKSGIYIAILYIHDQKIIKKIAVQI